MLYIYIYMYVNELKSLLLFFFVCVCVHRYIWWNIFTHIITQKSSSSSCRAASRDIPDPLSARLPIVHRLWLVFGVTSRIIT